MSGSSDDLRLKPVDEPGLPEFIEIPDEGLNIGRDPDNLLVLDGDRHPYTSSYHARIHREGSGLVIEDLESKNGTLVNGKTIQRQSLKAGDIVQLGREIGARFLVVSNTTRDQTLDIGVVSKSRRRDSMSVSAIIRLKTALGLPENAEHIGKMVRRNRRSVFAVLALFCILLFAAVYGFSYLLRDQREKVAELRDINAALEGSLAKFTGQVEREESAREQRIARLESEKDGLQEKIDALEVDGKASEGGIDDLRKQLKDTNTRLEQYNPLNLEKEEENQRKKLGRVLASIAYIEKKIAFREKDGDRYLHSVGESSMPELRKPENDEDLFFDDAASGSGFCVSKEGWLVTNAHVVGVPEVKRPLEFEDTVLVMEPRLEVIFSGTSTGHPAKIVSIADDDEEDFALIKIEPFEGMPYIEDFDIDVDVPPAGTEVRLFGFPLGKILLREEESFTASIFAGIVSRESDPYIQVQAAVYPGNSGGPAVDGDARVIGIVTGVQTVPGGQIASDIGFVLPIRDLAKLWPPREEL